MKSYKTDGNNRVILSKDMKIIELIDADYRLLSILLRLDIQLPFGDISIDEMCRRYDMTPALFLMICKMYAFIDYEPSTDGLGASDMPHLVKYLRASHKYYTQTLLPRIDKGIAEVLNLCDERQRGILKRFYQGYVDDLLSHLEYEECQMFPYVESLAKGEVVDNVRMDVFMENHSDICEKIDDIKSIVIKYLPESCSTERRCELLFDIFTLREDLQKHTQLETKILAPVAVAEERRRGV